MKLIPKTLADDAGSEIWFELMQETGNWVTAQQVK